ncbi:Macro domain-containing protein [Mycena chlorophos]|uniref:Macro domain-containing protein n=1 Tax=Mycena chlorophos TaxID=658473 RepID=A0A8H6WLI1_MYCCL|nr:Macro domain-containing protein [Mycena chlorophos]
MSRSSSDSEEDVSIVRLPDIPTLTQLYEKGQLKPAKATRHEPNAELLNRVSLFQGDITLLEVDSIVNAANRSLLGGGGVDGAIHAAAGRELLKECAYSHIHPSKTSLIHLRRRDAQRMRNWRREDNSGLQVAIVSPKHIIHAVGPVYSRSDVETRAKQLESCYQTSLEIAVKEGLKHVAFCCISTGIYGYPVPAATHIALDTVRRFLESEDGSKLDRIIFVRDISVVIWLNKDLDVYESLIPEHFPPAPVPAISDAAIEPEEEVPVSEELSQLPDAPAPESDSKA